MSTSFTQYAHGFMNRLSGPINQQSINQNINYYLNNSNVTINNKETYNINNNILVINKFPDKSEVYMGKSSKIVINDFPSPDDEMASTKIKKYERIDRTGIQITKGSKKHKITFADNLKRKASLVDKVEIESYKKYNASNTFLDQKKGKSGSVSCCAIY